MKRSCINKFSVNCKKVSEIFNIIEEQAYFGVQFGPLLWSTNAVNHLWNLPK